MHHNSDLFLLPRHLEFKMLHFLLRSSEKRCLHWTQWKKFLFNALHIYYYTLNGRKINIRSANKHSNKLHTTVSVAFGIPFSVQRQKNTATWRHSRGQKTLFALTNENNFKVFLELIKKKMSGQIKIWAQMIRRILYVYRHAT